MHAVMEGLQQDLEAIKVEPPAAEVARSDEAVPESYRSNNKKEKLLLSYAENFQRQFRQLYGDRKTLFLRPTNECGVEKFICTTLRPTELPYKELYDYDGCAGFVADYLAYQPLKPPNELPDSLVSPTLVLGQQKGNSFDYSVLLSSLLIGSGYDAYCVCGYASQDVTLLNQTRKPCPLLDQAQETSVTAEDEKRPKYTVRPPRDLSSRFLVRQEAKKQAQIEAEGRRKREEEEARIAEAEKPPPDKFHGLRFHCWVLVLAGKREVAQSFFIEPTTGETHSLDWEEYLGIETLWNHKNYWVNMQDCSQGVQGLVYDLGDATRWEFFFPNVDKPLLVVPGEDHELEEATEEDEEEIKDDFELPPSWVLPIELSAREFETRCPRGSKTVLYQKAKLEKFAPYLNQDGLVTRLTLYHDTARRDRHQVRSSYQHREDKLRSRVENVKIGQVHEEFSPGRPRSLKEHIHHESNPLRASNRTMLFYSHARVDGLAKREMTATETTEHFENRPDFLYYRHVTFAKSGKRFEPASASQQRTILTVVEQFHHNPAIPPNDDVAERTFILSENRIKVVYHLEENRITPSMREFLTPPMRGDQATTLTYSPEMSSVYQVDPYAKEPKDRHLFEQLQELVKAQDETIAQIRAAERETQDILNARMKEELNTTLAISVYDVGRNEKARQHKQEMEQKLAEEERIRREKQSDYLAPFLARIGDPPELHRKQMEEVAEDCLKDLRMRLVEMANIIQGRFEHETEELQLKQAWYKANQGSLTRETEAEYISQCNEAMFRIHILEQRLNRHKTTAPQKYIELERRLKSDPRLALLYAQ